MPVYTVHEPRKLTGNPVRDAERFQFVRDGFHFWAFLLGPVWMLFRRMWLVFVLYVIVMAGITRYASVHMPMDETLSRVVIDISGRPVLVFKVDFPRDKVGAFDTELVREWFNAFAMNAGVTLHVETLYGENSHHIAESCFKGLARALRTAVAIDPRAAGEVPSTKGTLGN